MKKLLFPLLILVCASACAQPSHLDQFYDKYHAAGNSGGDQSSFDPGVLFNISFSSGDTGDGWMHKVTAVHGLVLDGKKSAGAGREWNDLSDALKADHFEEWVSIRKGKGKAQLLSRDGKNDLTEVVALIVGDDNSGLFFHLRGHFTAADKARMEAALQTHDGE